MTRHFMPIVLVCAAMASPALAAETALVTLATGSVTQADGTTPSAPFVLKSGQTITLGEGGSVVVLAEGTATRLRGPRTVSMTDLHAPSVGTQGQTSGAALTQVLSRDVSFAKAGASRGGALTLTRPIAGGQVQHFAGVSWRCEDCGPQTVSLTPLMADDPIWTTQATDTAAYDGASLAPGPYLVRVGDEEFAMTIATQGQSKGVKTAVQHGLSLLGDSEDDVALKPSVVAGIYWSAGLTADALWTLDAAAAAHPESTEIVELRRAYEQRLGLVKP
ncbi:MAG: hypothetical protein AB8H79_03090 [Myxococcota bacterium]